MMAVARTDLEQRQEAARRGELERRAELQREGALPPAKALGEQDRNDIAHRMHAQAMARRDRLEADMRATFEEIERAQEVMAEDAKAKTEPEFSPMLDAAWGAWCVEREKARESHGNLWDDPGRRVLRRHRSEVSAERRRYVRRRRHRRRSPEAGGAFSDPVESALVESGSIDVYPLNDEGSN